MMFQCRKSMARIKAVMNERRLAYEGAVKIAEQQREEHHNKLVLQYHATQIKVERKYLQRRREYKARKEAERLKRGGTQEATGSIVDTALAEQVGKEAKGDPSELLHAQVKQSRVGSVEETKPETPLTQPKAVDAATVLVEDVQISSKQHR